MLVFPRGSRCSVPSATSSGMLLDRRSATAPVERVQHRRVGAVELRRAGERPLVVERLRPRDRARAQVRPEHAPQHLAARAQVGAAVPLGEHVAGLGEVGPAARAAAVHHALAGELGRPVAVREEQLLHRAHREALLAQPVGALEPLADHLEAHPRAQPGGHALLADDPRVALERVRRVGDPVRVVGVLDVVAALEARLALRADDALGDRVAVVAPLARRARAVEQDHAAGREQDRRLRRGRAALDQLGVDVRRDRLVGVVRVARVVDRDRVRPGVALDARVGLADVRSPSARGRSRATGW